MMLRGETAPPPSPLMIENGEWRGLQRAGRTFWECQSQKVEDVAHWLLECSVWCTQHLVDLKTVYHVCYTFENLSPCYRKK